MPKAIAICTPVTDYLINLDHIPQPNSFARLNAQSWQFGGNAATAIVTAARQGLDCGIIAPVGDDDMGSAQEVDFARHGVDTRYLFKRKDTATPFVIAMSDQETGGRSFLSAGSSIRRIQPEELDLDYLRTAKYLLLDSNTEATRLAADTLLAQGGEVMFDASSYSQSQEEMLPHTSIYIASEFYLKTRYPGLPALEACREMLRRGPHTVLFTLGAQGCVGLSKQGDEIRLPAFPVPQVVDTTGCGDTFHGAYIVALDRGLSPLDCARWASASSAIKCTAIGGRAGQPTAREVERFLQTGEMDLAFLPERLQYYQRVHYTLEDARLAEAQIRAALHKAESP